MADTRGKRRQNGTGGISQRSDGRWMGRVSAGYHPNGKRRIVTVYGKTEAECRKKVDAKIKQVARQGASVSTRTSTSVLSWGSKWIESRETKVRPKTFVADRWAVSKITDAIGTRKLSSLAPSDIEAVMTAMAEDDAATSSQLRVFRTAIKMLSDAVLEGHDVPQRIFHVPSPGVGESDRTELEVTHAGAVLQAAATLPHAARWLGALINGLRPNESLGLTWDEGVDFDRGTITVCWQLQELQYLDAKDKSKGFRMPRGYRSRHLTGAWHLVEVKSKSGYRVIPMVPWFREALLAWRDVAPASEWDLVFPDADGNPARTPSDIEEWQSLQDSASLLLGEPVRHATGRYYVRHEARHTTATLLMEAGVDPKIITAIMGHSSITTTRGYQHVRTERALEALEKIAPRLQGASPSAIEGTPA